MTHRCPAKDCGQNLPDHLLMCKPHWHMVPYRLRREVLDAYEGGAGIGTVELLDAQSEAIYAVNMKLTGAAS